MKERRSGSIIIHKANWDEGVETALSAALQPFLLVKDPKTMYACHIEYDYFDKGDCIDLSTLEDTYYLYPA